MRAPRLIALATLFLHAALATRYGFFRDELYFIACGRHPAFGYVDQPPLVPLLAAATQLGGDRLWLLRVLAGLAHAATVYLAAMLARRVADAVDQPTIPLPSGPPAAPSGATAPLRPAPPAAPAAPSRFAPALAAVATAISPEYLGLHSLFGTTTFEPLAWTAIAYLVTDAILADRPRSLVWAGLVSGLALEAKYALPFYLAPLLAGVLLGPDRRVLWSRSAALGALIAIVLAAPSLVWQAKHGLPFLELMHAAGTKNTRIAPLAFVLNQLKIMNPLMAPVWLAGLVATLGGRRYARVRFLGIGFAGVFAEMVLMHGKDYYVAPAYASMFALGAVAFADWVRPLWIRATHLTLAAAVTLLALPAVVPLLDPPLLARYLRHVPIEPQPQERSAVAATLPQHLSDMFGWPELAQSVATVWRALPDDERAHAAIVTDNYGEAAAVDFFGARLGLPPALSGHNQYWMWGTRGYDGSVLIILNADVDEFRPHCRDVRRAGRFGVPLAMPYEDDQPILVCHGLTPSLPALWPRFKGYR